MPAPVAVLAGLLLAAGLTACQAPSPPRFDTNAPGWRIRQGQAVWRPAARADDIAGELVVAQHPDGRAFVEFAKPPVTLASAAQQPRTWQFALPLQRRAGHGRNPPPPTVLWFQLLNFLRGAPPADDWQGENFADGRWRLGNRRTGERLEGWLAP